MFAVRHTDQSVVKHALGLDGKWTDSAIRQFDIFKGLLEKIDPPVIVVPNAFASERFRNALKVGDIEDMSAEHGCHFVGLRGREVPVFFSGMLTGQGVMDRYSRQRLVNQVRRMIFSLGYDTRRDP